MRRLLTRLLPIGAAVGACSCAAEDPSPGPSEGDSPAIRDSPAPAIASASASADTTVPAEPPALPAGGQSGTDSEDIRKCPTVADESIALDAATTVGRSPQGVLDELEAALSQVETSAGPRPFRHQWVHPLLGGETELTVFLVEHAATGTFRGSEILGCQRVGLDVTLHFTTNDGLLDDSVSGQLWARPCGDLVHPDAVCLHFYGELVESAFAASSIGNVLLSRDAADDLTSMQAGLQQQYGLESGFTVQRIEGGFTVQRIGQQQGEQLALFDAAASLP